MRKEIANGFITVGVLLIIGALLLTGYNIWDEHRANRKSEEILEELDREMDGLNPEDSEMTPDYILDPEMEMPVKRIGGMDCIGVIEIPALGIRLPVISEWSYAKLKEGPCRYQGSAYENNLIIAAHNYRGQFGALRRLELGDSVTFTDVEGHAFDYAVADVQVLDGTAVKEMTSGDWDLTMFTCTLSRTTRITIRCSRVER